MSRLTRDGTAEPVSRDQILRRERGKENIHFPCSADYEQDWQPYPVDPSSAMYRMYQSLDTPPLTDFPDSIAPQPRGCQCRKGRFSKDLVESFL